MTNNLTRIGKEEYGSIKFIFNFYQEIFKSELNPKSL